MIKLQELSKKFGDNQVLNKLSLDVNRGETLVIVGSSGTGKSVTLKHILGLLTPDSGSIIIDDKDICQLHGAELEALRSKFGVLFQSGALINWLTVRENIALPLYEGTKLSHAEINKRVQKALALVELVDAGEQSPTEISGGMKKRAGLARAIITAPEIILYDEPTSGLDPILSRKIDKLIVDLSNKLQVTSIVVTHDMISALKIADRIAMLAKGELVEVNTPHKFLKSKNPVVREFIDAQLAVEFN